MKESVLLFALILLIVQGQITVFIRQNVEMNQNCMLLITCISGPIQGNLFWYATVNGDERRFARNDGGNAEPNPSYNEISLAGVMNYNTWVTREIIGDNLFTSFNSTLAFNIGDLVDSDISDVFCGSTTMNSSTSVNPLDGKLQNDAHFSLEKGNKNNLYVCTGLNVPLILNFGLCNVPYNVIQWIFNGNESTIALYSLNNPANQSCQDDRKYGIQNIINSSDGSTANITSTLTICSGSFETLQCGSKVNFSRIIYNNNTVGSQKPSESNYIIIVAPVVGTISVILIGIGIGAAVIIVICVWKKYRHRYRRSHRKFRLSKKIKAKQDSIRFTTGRGKYYSQSTSTQIRRSSYSYRSEVSETRIEASAICEDCSEKTMQHTDVAKMTAEGDESKDDCSSVGNDRQSFNSNIWEKTQHMSNE